MTLRTDGVLEKRTAFPNVGVATERKETFVHDKLRRVTDANTDINSVFTRGLDFSYNDLGNLLSKTSTLSSDTDVTNYVYGAGNAGPNAVTSATIEGTAYTLTYNDNGAIEKYDRAGFVHMNGRVFDPTLGRFLSPDPIIQAPTMSQNWNQFSYVLNSPSAFVDPTGFTLVVPEPDPPWDPDKDDAFISMAYLYMVVGRGLRLATPIVKGPISAKGPGGLNGDESDPRGNSGEEVNGADGAAEDLLPDGSAVERARLSSAIGRAFAASRTLGAAWRNKALGSLLTKKGVGGQRKGVEYTNEDAGAYIYRNDNWFRDDDFTFVPEHGNPGAVQAFGGRFGSGGCPQCIPKGVYAAIIVSFAPAGDSNRPDRRLSGLYVDAAELIGAPYVVEKPDGTLCLIRPPE